MTSLNPLLSDFTRMVAYDLETVGNGFEAGLWIFVSGLLFVKAVRASGLFRRAFSILTGGFFVFGLSDIVESQTGAWWRPLWLLLVKAICIAVLFSGFRAYYRLVRRQTADSTRPFDP